MWPTGQGLGKRELTLPVMRTITTPLPSMSDSRPNADVSAAYSSVSNSNRSVSRSAVESARPLASSTLSWNTAIWVPTLRAKATTVGCVVQSALPQTLKTRLSPTIGGTRASGAAAWGWLSAPTRLASSRSARRSVRSNCSCAGRTAGPRSAAASGGAAAGTVAPCSRKADASSGTPLAACGTRRNCSADPEPFGPNTAHPAVCVGSIAVYAATERLTCPALAAVHGVSLGCVLLELQATAQSDNSPARRPFGIRDVLRGFPGAPERPAEADRPDHLVHPNHRYHEGLERDPPLGKGAPRHLRQPERAPGLRHQAEPTLAREHGGHARMPPSPEQAVSQARGPQPDQQQHPWPQLGQYAQAQASTRQDEE